MAVEARHLLALRTGQVSGRDAQRSIGHDMLILFCRRESLAILGIC